jgi:hypothetical protein
VFTNSPCEFYSFMTSHVYDSFCSSSVLIITLSIFCNAGVVDMNHFSLSLFLHQS